MTTRPRRLVLLIISHLVAIRSNTRCSFKGSCEKNALGESRDVASILTSLRVNMSLSVQLATQKEQEQSWLQWHAVWGTHRSRDYHLRRLRFLSQLEFNQHHRKVYILRSTEEKSYDKTTILCSGDLITRPCLYRPPYTCDVLNKEITAIASIYTPPEHRRKGFAAYIVKHLRQFSQNDEHVVASCLYSNVGPDYYQKHGEYYKHTVYRIMATSSMLSSMACFHDQVRPVYYADLPRLLDENYHRLFHELQKSSLSPYPKITVLPTLDAIQSVLHSETIPDDNITPPSPLPQDLLVGARIASQSGDEFMSGFFLWCLPSRDQHLGILHYHYNSMQEAQLLLQAAQCVAQNHNFDRVALWLSREHEGDLENWSKLPGVVQVNPEDDKEVVPALAWLYDTNFIGKEVEWRCNHLFTWV